MNKLAYLSLPGAKRIDFYKQIIHNESMKINSVIVKTVIVINEKEYIRSEENWTESIKDAKKEGVEFKNNQDIFDWVEIN